MTLAPKLEGELANFCSNVTFQVKCCFDNVLADAFYCYLMLLLSCWYMFDSRTLSSCLTSAAISLADTGLNGASEVGKIAVGLKGDGL